MEYELVMGLETHIELNTQTKIFCRCPVRFGQPPNTDCCPVCIGMPGTLPVLNREAVHFAALAGLALHCEVHLKSQMSRKHYFYPDLAKAYQITQQQVPICGPGWLELSNGKVIRIQRIHMEEDAGKLIHNGSDVLVDYNRAGVPLIEIVTHPDFRSAREAADYLEQLQGIMRYLGISDGKMQEGSLRCDVNISVRPKGQRTLGERTEIKNMNSLSYLVKAVEYEFRRQAELLERGEEVCRETRRYDQKTGTTQLMRKKEAETDYLYFEEPDIPPVVLSPQELEAWNRELPELPMQKRKRYQQEGLSLQEASALVKYPKIAAYFEEACRWVQKPSLAAKWMLTHLFASFQTEGEKEAGAFPLSPRQFGEFLQGIEAGSIRRNYAKEVLAHLIATGDPLEQSLAKIQKEDMGEKELETLCQTCLQLYPEAAADYLRGKKQAIKALLGAAMKLSKGRANPQQAQQMLEKLIHQKEKA